MWSPCLTNRIWTEESHHTQGFDQTKQQQVAANRSRKTVDSVGLWSVKPQQMVPLTRPIMAKISCSLPRQTFHHVSPVLERSCSCRSAEPHVLYFQPSVAVMWSFSLVQLKSEYDSQDAPRWLIRTSIRSHNRHLLSLVASVISRFLSMTTLDRYVVLLNRCWSIDTVATP